MALLSEMVRFSPARRISIDEALEHPFFTAPSGQEERGGDGGNGYEEEEGSSGSGNPILSLGSRGGAYSYADALLSDIDEAAGSAADITALDDEEHAFRPKKDTEKLMDQTLWALVKPMPWHTDPDPAAPPQPPSSLSSSSSSSFSSPAEASPTGAKKESVDCTC